MTPSLGIIMTHLHDQNKILNRKIVGKLFKFSAKIDFGFRSIEVIKTEEIKVSGKLMKFCLRRKVSY